MLPATTRLAPALDYPTRPVHLIEGFGAGGAPDIIARLMGQALSEQLGQSFVIENRAGAKQQYCRRGGGAGTPGWLHRLLPLQRFLCPPLRALF